MNTAPVNDSALDVVKPTPASSGLSVVHATDISVMEQVIIKGNLAELEPRERVQFYLETCRSIGLNPWTKPFEYIDLDGVLTLYAKRDATDQLRRLQGVTTKIVSRELVDGIYIVTAQATTKDGRADESIGAVALVKEDGDWVDVLDKNGKKIEDGTWQDGRVKYKRKFQANGKQTPLTADQRANAMMKAETKAKRRVTLSICGLGWLDESEVGSIAQARVVQVDAETGEILDVPAPAVNVVDDERWEGGCTKKQLQRLNIIRQQKGVTADGLKKMHGKTSGKLLTESEAADLIAMISDYPDIVVDESAVDASFSELPGMPTDTNRYTA
jgi:hypothetical protein